MSHFLTNSHLPFPAPILPPVLAPRSTELFLSATKSPPPPCVSVPGLSRFRLSDIQDCLPGYVYTSNRHRTSGASHHADWPRARNGQGRASCGRLGCPIAHWDFGCSVPRFLRIYFLFLTANCGGGVFLRHCLIYLICRKRKTKEILIKMACAYHIQLAEGLTHRMGRRKLSPFNRMETHFSTGNGFVVSGIALPGLFLFFCFSLLLVFCC